MAPAAPLTTPGGLHAGAWPMARDAMAARRAARLVRLIAAYGLMLTTAMAQHPATPPPTPPATLPQGNDFYFGRTRISIQGPDIQVPRIDRDTVAAYADLGLQDEVYLGRTDHDGRLTYLETWTRQPVQAVSLDLQVDGLALRDHAVPFLGDDIASQQPAFFLRKGAQWHPVPAEATLGETTFIRLRWLAPLDGGAPIRDAEILRQSLHEIHEYRYGGDGRLVGATRRRRETDFAVEVLPSIPD